MVAAVLPHALRKLAPVDVALTTDIGECRIDSGFHACKPAFKFDPGQRSTPINNQGLACFSYHPDNHRQ
jgi:hypothetical protein